MKTKQYFKPLQILFSFCFILLFSNSNAQLISRTSIHDYTPAEQLEIACALKEVLELNNYAFPKMHHMNMGTYNPPSNSYIMEVHDEHGLLPWHRSYVERVENYFINRTGLDHIPGWDTNDPLPLAFTASMCEGANGNNIVVHPSFVAFDFFSPGTYNHGISGDITYPGVSNYMCSYNDVVELYGGVNMPQGGPHARGHYAISDSPGSTFESMNTNTFTPLFFLYHGYIDDIWQYWQCRSCDPHSLYGKSDLYIKDLDDYFLHDMPVGGEEVIEGIDLGTEPFDSPGPAWEAPEIWVKDDYEDPTLPTANFEHEDPTYEADDRTAYIYVRVRNRGCIPTVNNAHKLNLYWAAASPSQAWPAPWDGSATYDNGTDDIPLGGSIVLDDPIQVINARRSTIKVYEWEMPNPYHYGFTGWQNHFCLLAQIDEGNTPMISDYNNLSKIVKDNNDIAWKNLTIWGEVEEDYDERVAGPAVFIGNFTKDPQNYAIGFWDQDNLFDEGGRITLTFEPKSFEKIMKTAQLGKGVYLSKVHKYSLVFTNANSGVRNLAFEAREVHPVGLRVDFGLKSKYGKAYEFDLIQKNKKGQVIGGQHYEWTNRQKRIKERKMDDLGDHSLRVYPNPSSGNYLFVEGADLIPGQSYQIRVIDNLGKTLLTQKIDNLDSNRIQLNINQLKAQSSYFIQLFDNDGNSYARRFVKLE